MSIPESASRLRWVRGGSENPTHRRFTNGRPSPTARATTTFQKQREAACGRLVVWSFEPTEVVRAVACAFCLRVWGVGACLGRRTQNTKRKYFVSVMVETGTGGHPYRGRATKKDRTPSRNCSRQCARSLLMSFLPRSAAVSQYSRLAERPSTLTPTLETTMANCCVQYKYHQLIFCAKQR